MTLILSSKREKQHPKCGGYSYETACGTEYDCKYQSSLDCEDCKYGLGNKDPEAKCNAI